MRNTIEKALQKIRKKERKYLERVQSCKGLANKIVVPQKAQAALTAAFARGLDLVLKKGDWLIRRGISETEITQAFHEQDSRARQKLRAGQLRTLGTRARQVRRRGSGVSLAEGVGLGVLGIGLPDIPIFLGGLLRGIYQIALSYGVDVREKHEQVYLMLLLACAGAPQQERQERLDWLAQEIQAGREISECLELVQREAAESLAQGMLTAKFIQGLPIVGVAGGIYNLPLYRRITGYAMLQYQKRYLWGLSARK
ncbi:MAG: EcsC family protein [Butyricicoccus pullicaecorum]|nr:EcsC family protein [Butyricicoccus pullicaecorum]